jgi:MFS family permease
MANTTTATGGEFARGWPVLSSAAVGVGLGLSPLPFYTIGVMIGPILGEFAPLGWTAGDVLFALTIYTIGAFLMSPVIGILAERFGARRVALISIVTFSLGMMGLALNTGSKPLYWLLWAFVAVGGAGTLPITFTRPVANWFSANRGKALGIALIATGVFGSLAKYFTQHILEGVNLFGFEIQGWRAAYVAVGMLPLLIALPINFLSLRDVGDEPAADAAITRFKIPVLAISGAGVAWLVWMVIAEVWPLFEQNGLTLAYAQAFGFIPLVILPILLALLLPIGTRPPVRELSSDGQKIELPGMTLVEALKTWRFWLLALTFVPISYAIGAVIPNIEQIVTIKVFDATRATATPEIASRAVELAAITGLAVLAGRLIGGFLIDKFWAPAIAFIFLASPAIALYMLGQPGVSFSLATLAIFMIGFGAGVEYDFMAYMVSKYFGMKKYAAIYGAIYGFFAIGAGFGPTIMSNFADAQGWTKTLIEAAILLFVSTVPLLFLGRYKYDDHGKIGESIAEAEETVETARA